MPRSTRVEYDGACYHVINRGNFRSWIFQDDGAKDAFELCLAEAAVRMGWIVHGWVIMGNHYHLALETSEGNLSQGMQWLQVTFSARFNAFRKEHGHVFQGRYKAIPVERGDALGRVCHYIDLNPVRAGMVPLDGLSSYRHGSFFRLLRPKERPVWFEPRTALAAAGRLGDTKKGHEAYLGYLGWLSEEVVAGREQEFLLLSKGMAIGGEDFLQDIRRRLTATNNRDRNLDARGKRQLRERVWSERLRELLNAMPAKQRTDARVSARWKAVIADQLKTETDVSNAWLAATLHMGSATYVSKQVGQVRSARLRKSWLKGKT